MKYNLLCHSRSGLGTEAATEQNIWIKVLLSTRQWIYISRQQNYLHPDTARFTDLIQGTKGERRRLEVTENEVKAPEKLLAHHGGPVLSTQHYPICHLFCSSCTVCYLRRKESLLLKRSPCQEVWHVQRKQRHIHAEAGFGQLSLLQQARVRGLCIILLCGYGVCHRTHIFFAMLQALSMMFYVFTLCFYFRVEKRPLKTKSILSQINTVYLSQQAALTQGFRNRHNLCQPHQVHKLFLTSILTWYISVALTD